MTHEASNYLKMKIKYMLITIKNICKSVYFVSASILYEFYKDGKK